MHKNSFLLLILISTFYLSCTNCATTYFLEPGIIIDSINFEKNAVINNDDSAIRIKDQTLLRTKDFICPNSECKVKDIDKEAIIYSAKAVGFKGLGINYNSFVHVDNRPKEATW